MSEVAPRTLPGLVSQRAGERPGQHHHHPHRDPSSTHTVLLVATAFSGTGMTYSAITALMVRDIVTERKNPYIKLYDPKRTPTLTQLWKKGRDYTEEFFRGAVANLLK